MGALFHVEYAKVYRLWAFYRLEGSESGFLVKTPKEDRIFNIDPEKLESVIIHPVGETGREAAYADADPGRVAELLNSFRWWHWTWEPEPFYGLFFSFDDSCPPETRGSIRLRAKPTQICPPDRSGTPDSDKAIESPSKYMWFF
ncbi:hypothetical protein D7X94_15940 [Acutalibacter sp. 1XD8-33]|nr:hypothetical protein D7X94_15940 [Acutalibacter sp. 1XD8-33]